MDDKENLEGFEKDWKTNQTHDDSDYGLPHIAYDPLEKDDLEYDRDFIGQNLNRDLYEERRRSPVLLIFMILFLVAGIVFGVYWFQFRDTGQGVVATPDSYQLPTPVRPDVVHEPVITEQFVVQESEPVSSMGVTLVVSSLSSSYYVVIGSFIDSDLAMDYSKQLNSQGMNTYLIEPVNNNKFYRLAVGNFGTWGEAADNLEGLKNNFGQDIWVLKY
jgi:hypothetical protein